MRNGQVNNLKRLMPIRKELRNGATEAERILWQQLKGYQLAGRKFRRQHSIGLFILDFYCPSERLAIELDGGVHDLTAVKTHDEERQQAIETLDIRIIRFRNADVLQDVNAVLERIAQHFLTKKPPPTPS